MSAPRRRRVGHRRRVEDEGDDDGGPDALDLEDDSLSDGSGLTDDDDPADDSDTSNIEDDASPTAANPRKPAGNGAIKPAGRPALPNKPPTKAITDAEMMLQGLSITDSAEPVQELHFDDIAGSASPKISPDAPLIVSSASATRPAQDTAGDRRRREHEEYKRRRDEDPSFVPNRGAFLCTITATLDLLGTAFAHKPVRISLPDHPPKYIFPATDRSFIFIPRAMRPNQKPGIRGGKAPKSVLGSVGGWSRRTSVIGSYYGGSTYSPSVARSRRSSIAPDGRDYMFSPTGSVVSRAAIPLDPLRPVVRLPPAGNVLIPDGPVQMPQMDRPVGESLINTFPPPQTHPLPQKPSFQETHPTPIPMHQPRPQKTVSVADIESPTLNQHPSQQQQPPQQQPPYQQAFHQQMPMQMANGGPPDNHTRNPSFQSQHSIGTPLSQIPERAIHAAPFQPNAYPQPPYYNQPYPVMQTQPNYYYPAQPPYAGGNLPSQASTAPAFANAQGQGPIAQEVNGMVYYYDPSQMQAVNPYQNYPGPQGYVPGMVSMPGMVAPNPESYYPYPQTAQGMVYYPQ
ncbi:unnamed protein product [Parascedosporium putredinis]|uniref:Btz domain-containing protein n=1 Tax=Parascedosporium putredinis TaxID=1442378 RepID=A0A9P1H3M0_9PEZI|nr:unnamed protein product [Parascedosporium putredinis]CAI7995949.1 unnamed protein product [Parascedosporium putredinis]